VFTVIKEQFIVKSLDIDLYNMVNYLKYGKKIPDKRFRKDLKNLPEDLLQLGKVR